MTVPTFSEKSEDFDLFWSRMMASASMKVFSDCIDPVKDTEGWSGDVTWAFKTVALMNIENEEK